jgi:predicted TIM-barrel fold metal-dependent hydrolase
MPVPSTDCHTHVGIDTAFYLTGWLPYASSAQDLLGHLDAAGIDRAVCFPFCTPSAFDSAQFARNRALTLLPGRFPYDRENGVLVAEVEQLGARNRLLPFAMFDPGRAVAQQVEHLRSLIERIAGLKTQTTLLRSPVRALLGDTRALMDLAEQHNLPVVIHTAVHPDDPWAQVRDCLAVAEAHPRVRFNLAHSLRFDDEALRRSAELDNVWIDCSAHLLHCQLARADAPVVPPRGRRVDADYADPAAVLEAIHAIVGDRYLWGSDSPYQSWSDDMFKGIYTYQEEAEVLRRLPPRIADSMTYDAPRAWLGER